MCNIHTKLSSQFIVLFSFLQGDFTWMSWGMLQLNKLVCACVFVMSDASSPLANRLMLWHSCEAMSWWPCSDVLRHHCLWPQHNCCWHKIEHMERECLCTSHDFRTLSLTHLWFIVLCSVAVPDRYLYFKPLCPTHVHACLIWHHWFLSPHV